MLPLLPFILKMNSRGKKQTARLVLLEIISKEHPVTLIKKHNGNPRPCNIDHTALTIDLKQCYVWGASIMTAPSLFDG